MVYSDEISIIWTIEDVLYIRPDLEEYQAREVLQEIKSNHDASIGVNWSVIEFWCDELFPEEAKDV